MQQPRGVAHTYPSAPSRRVFMRNSLRVFVRQAATVLRVPLRRWGALQKPEQTTAHISFALIPERVAARLPHVARASHAFVRHGSISDIEGDLCELRTSTSIRNFLSFDIVHLHQQLLPDIYQLCLWFDDHSQQKLRAVL